jgi:ATP-dependent DNA helicase DinG
MTNSVDLLKQIVMLKPGGEVREQQHTAVSEIEASLQEKKNLLLEAPTGSGKALRLDTPILTTKGWSTMGELVEGDVIYGTKGTTTVTKAHDAFFSKELYSLKFSNGQEIFADSDHLWNVEPFGKTLDLPSQITELDIERMEVLKGKSLQIISDGETTALTEIEPVTLYPKEIVLAAFSRTSIVEEGENSATAPAFEFLENLYQELLGRESTWRTGDIAKAYEDEPVNNLMVFTIQRNQPITFENESKKLPAPSRLYGEWLGGADSVFNADQMKALRELGIISSNIIPKEYFFTPVSHRLQLLTGIFGGEDSGEFRTTSQALAEDIQFLIATLGRTSDHHTYVRESGETVELIVLHPSTETSEKIVSIDRVESAMVRCITVDAEDHLFLAGEQLIPTHNTLSYLIPLVENETLAVVSTATKQLSEQIMHDIAFLNTSLKALKSPKRADATLLKGRDNYLCLSKFDDILRLEDKANTLFSVGDAKSALSDRANKLVAETKAVSDWANETETGDRTEAPAASDETWRQYSSTNAECPGRSACPFGQECFAELARDKAKEAKIVITNHAIVALDLDSEGQLLGDRDVFVFDELHELDTYMSSAWGAELTFRKIDTVYKTLKSIPSLDEKLIDELKALMDEYDKALRSIEKGLIDNEDSSIKLENFIIKLANVMTKITANVSRKEKESGTDALKRIYTKGKKMSMELLTVAETLSKTDMETVRWTVDSADRKKFEPKKPAAKRGKATTALTESSSSTMSLHAAPLRIGPKLQNKLTGREAIMVGLSATVTVMGRTDIPIHNLGLDEKPHNVVVLDTPFDYKKQAMLYIPNPSTFPLPIGATRKEHTAAMTADSAKLIEAAGGRALILSTTADGVETYAEYYRKKLPKIDFLAQGDAPNSQLVATFKEQEQSCLIGTMGFWHGLDAPGKTLSLDIIDKIPFPTPDDPLLMARKNYADKLGRNGFMEIYVTIADWMLRQGFGRAIRSKSDRAVIAIYDTRLIHKNYGKAILQNFHGVGLYHDHDKVAAALKRLVQS